MVSTTPGLKISQHGKQLGQKRRPPKLALPGLALCFAMVASACTDAGRTAEPEEIGESVVLTAALETVDSCEVLLDRIQDDALKRVGPFGLEPDYPVTVAEDGRDEETAADTDMSSGGAADDSASAPKETSGTNNQEVGVDEADLIKSDGRFLAAVRGNELKILDVTGSEPVLDHTVPLRSLGSPTGMFLNEDTLLLVSDKSSSGTQQTLLTEVNLKTGKLGESTAFDGGYISSRMTDGTVRLVLRTQPNGLDFVFPERGRSEKDAKRANQRIIEDSTLDDWLPQTQTGRDSTEPLVECDQVHFPSEYEGSNQIVVVTTDAENPTETTSALSVFSDSETVYASTDRLVVATNRWDSEETALHTFDVTQTDSTGYVASGSVDGHLLNQYSVSEHEGYIRVATTLSGRTRTTNRLLPLLPFTDRAEPAPVSESQVAILTENGAALEEIGHVGDLGRNERIFAVRFIGEVGYVVTFRQTDPLYTIDLSDPTNPTVMGELKIPGFSNYLHPIDGRTLMGVGSDGTDSGQILGAAVSLFDVEDLSDPTRLDKVVFAEGTESPVAFDAKAFTYWPETQTAIVPVSGWGPLQPDAQPASDRDYENPQSAAAVLSVDTEQGRMELQGWIEHASCDRTKPARRGSDNRRVPRESEEAGQPAPDQDLPADSQTQPAEDQSTEPAVEPAPSPCNEVAYIDRTMVIGDEIYAFSDFGVSVHTLADVEQTAWIPFL